MNNCDTDISGDCPDSFPAPSLKTGAERLVYSSYVLGPAVSAD